MCMVSKNVCNSLLERLLTCLCYGGRQTVEDNTEVCAVPVHAAAFNAAITRSAFSALLFSVSTCVM